MTRAVTPRARTLALGFILVAAGAMAGEVYKWKDAEGRLNYSDQPPDKAKAEKIKTDRAPPVDPETQARLQRQKEMVERAAEERAAREAEKTGGKPVAASPPPEPSRPLSGAELERYLHSKHPTLPGNQ